MNTLTPTASIIATEVLDISEARIAQAVLNFKLNATVIDMQGEEFKTGQQQEHDRLLVDFDVSVQTHHASIPEHRLETPIVNVWISSIYLGDHELEQDSYGNTVFKDLEYHLTALVQL